MQIFSIFGLVSAIAGLASCTAKEAGYLENNGQPILATFDLSDILANKLQEEPETIDIPLDSMNFVKKKVVDVLKEVYLKDIEKSQQDAMSRDDAAANETISFTREHETEEAPRPDVEATATDWDPTTEMSASDGEASSDTTTMPEELLVPNSTLSRSKRATVINVPIPTLLGHVPGSDDPDQDVCDRDEVLLDDGDCYELLEQGPCEDEHYVIMDPATKKGFCAPRLCAPGKVFLFNDQLCHDPREAGLCPPGRMLFTSSFGTPLCGCPDGTYEEDDDLDDDVCEPILGQIANCPPGQVFWFSDFRSPPTCKPDPCKGVNLKRGPEDLPYVPSLVDGKCYKIGTQPKICRRDQYYSLSLEYLRGVCSTLDDAGYTVLDSGDISSLTQTFGNFITDGPGSTRPRFPGSDFFKHRFSSDSDSSRNSFSSEVDTPSRFSSKPRRPTRPNFLTFNAPNKRTKITPAGTTLLEIPEIGAPVMKMKNGSFYQHPIIIGQSVVASHHGDNEVDDDDAHHIMAIVPATHMNAFSTPLITLASGFPTHHFGRRSAKSDGSEEGSQKTESASAYRRPRHHRRKRSPLPFASPGNVIEPGLSSCRAGAIRDINAKCRHTVLPSRFPPSRPIRDVSPVRPVPSCPGGGFYGPSRTCTSSSSSISSLINRFGLG